jgi:hypothetical protein
LVGKISLDRYRSSQFKPDTASKAVSKRHKKEQEEFTSSLRSASGDAHRRLPEESSDEIDQEGKIEEDLMRPGSAAQLAQQFGISQSTMERVRIIMVEEEVDDEPL